nr:DUF2318 domain-containing protein [uncultured Niameybacter sp.]
MAQKKNNHTKKNDLPMKKILVILGAIVVIVGASLLTQNKNSGSNTIKPVTLSEAGDLIIPLNEVSEEASFYPVEVDGTKLEVLAIKASDGTVRTAFNTCQICYSSGRGYYVQNGDALICQNCGNQFAADQVEIARGGCNPVPIFAENKVVTNDSITISNEFLKQTKDIFANWKSEF